MFNEFKKEIEWGGRTLTLETGKVARQATGAVVATYGETTVLATVVVAKEAKPDADWLPLTVNFQEKLYAAGKIPGGFFKREGRPTEKETLICRLIDRPIRPLFVKGFYNEVQVIINVLSHDTENEADILALVATSAALTISGVPFLGPVGAAKIGYKDGEFILNPTIQQVKDSELELMLAGTSEGVLMVESEANELSEEVMLDAVKFGHEAFQPVIEAIIDLAEHCAKEPMDAPEKEDGYDELHKKIQDIVTEPLKKAYKIVEKQDRQNAISEAKAAAVEALANDEIGEAEIMPHFKEIESDIVRKDLLENSVRIDGRSPTQIRPILSEVSYLKRAHGSALFTRGETQSIGVTTIGDEKEQQMIDAITGKYDERFMLHYNFPPFSVGECGRTGGASRREIGHGKLAWRAMNPVLPSWDEFPCAIRMVSEVTESNGSSSMATVCSASLSMMDAGIPIKRPVAGIAMGLIKEGDKHLVLSDILGDEDHLGDMDFKVAGTEEGITSLQMDIKITSITQDIMKTALDQAKDGRLHILGEMAKTITEPREEISEHAPRTVFVQIPRSKIAEVIGSGGKTVKGIVEKSKAKVDINDDGKIKIFGANKTSAEIAVKMIEEITVDPEIGTIHDGKVIKIFDFGAMVSFFGSRAGLVHISELAQEKVAKVEDVVQIDDEVTVKVVGFDDRGRIQLSIKQAS